MQKCIYLSKKIVENKFPESWPENRPIVEKGEDRRSNRTRQNNKRADRKLESNDSLDIPDRVQISQLINAWPPFGDDYLKCNCKASLLWTSLDVLCSFCTTIVCKEVDIQAIFGIKLFKLINLLSTIFMQQVKNAANTLSIHIFCNTFLFSTFMLWLLFIKQRFCQVFLPLMDIYI